MTGCGICCDAFTAHYKALILTLAPLVYLPVFLINNTTQNRCLYVLLVMVTFWMSECIPPPVTSFIPMFVYPLMGILDSTVVSTAYLKETNMLLLGGLIIALAIEDSGVHNRIALNIILCIGSNLRIICLQLSLCTLFISMWISNTAALAIMIPIIGVCLKTLEEQGACAMYLNNTMEDETGKTVPTPRELLKPSRVTQCYFLTCCYAATIGGTGALIGSGSNIVLKGIYETYFPESPGIEFINWTLLNMPILLMQMCFTFIWMQIYFMGLLRSQSADAQFGTSGDKSEFVAAIKGKLEDLGPIRFKEILVVVMFLSAVLLWFFREPQFIPGWPSFITQHKVQDGCAAIIIALFLFTIPAVPNFIYMFSSNDEKRPAKESDPLITWKTVQTQLHWGIIFLVGGAFALSDGVIKTGTGKMFTEALNVLLDYPMFVIQVSIGFITIIVTEFITNVAVVNMLSPIICELAKNAGVHPIYLCVPVGILASHSFCMAVGTPPNALAKAAGSLPTSQMFLSGIPVKIITFVIFIAMFNIYGPVLYGDLTELPDWANSTISARMASICYKM